MHGCLDLDTPRSRAGVLHWNLWPILRRGVQASKQAMPLDRPVDQYVLSSAKHTPSPTLSPSHLSISETSPTLHFSRTFRRQPYCTCRRPLCGRDSASVLGDLLVAPAFRARAFAAPSYLASPQWPAGNNPVAMSAIDRRRAGESWSSDGQAWAGLRGSDCRQAMMCGRGGDGSATVSV